MPVKKYQRARSVTATRRLRAAPLVSGTRLNSAALGPSGWQWRAEN